MFSPTETNLSGNFKHICCVKKKKKEKNAIKLKSVTACICNEKHTAAKGGVQMFGELNEKPEVKAFNICPFIKWCRT